MEYEIRSTNTNDYNQLLNNSSSFILSTFKDETEEVEWKFKNMRVVSPDDSVNSSGINRRL
ncbi:22300_t:CDS:2 [Entrophospora sp. SA101]|nr:22300_t:CDS:2 [Entrophospora sp. SA101]